MLPAIIILSIFAAAVIYAAFSGKKKSSNEEPVSANEPLQEVSNVPPIEETTEAPVAERETPEEEKERLEKIVSEDQDKPFAKISELPVETAEVVEKKEASRPKRTYNKKKGPKQNSDSSKPAKPRGPKKKKPENK